MKEEWKIIYSTNNLWEISNFGRIRNTKKIYFKFKKDIEKNTILNKVFNDRIGHNVVSLFIEYGKSKKIIVPKIVLELFGDKTNNSRIKIKHIDGDLKNDMITNLIIVPIIAIKAREKLENQMMEICNNNNLEYIGVEYTNNKKNRVKFICNKHRFKGVQSSNVSHMKVKKHKCKYCSGKNISTYDFINDRRVGNDVYILSEYVNSHTKVSCLCLKCGNKWDTKPMVLKNGSKCPICAIKENSEKQKLTKYEIEKRLSVTHKNIIITEYKKDYVECLCFIHKKYFTIKLNSLLANDGGCPRCNKSIGENNISNWLDKNNILYEREKTFEDLKNISKLRFDFFIKDNMTAIEFQGEQHYLPINFSKKQNGIDKLKYTQCCDNIKKEYCKKNNIRLIEIPYWEKENIDNILKNKLK